VKAVRIPIYLLLALLAVACGTKSKEASNPKGSDGVVSGATDEGPETLVPEELKHDGYAYQGLGNYDLLTYDVTFEDYPKQEGTQQIKLDKVEDGKATYTLQRTGGLSRLGVETVELDATGIQIVSSSMGILKEPSQVMLAEASVGKTWETNLDMDNLNGTTQSVKSKITHKVTGNESVTVPAGTFDCLVVESTIQSESAGAVDPSNNRKVTMKMKAYFAKDIGVVKMSILEKDKVTGLVELKARKSSKETSGTGESKGQ
jgi:hypothetical protein